MNKLFLILVVSAFLLCGCRGQEGKKVAIDNEANQGSFEEKQKQALKQEERPNAYTGGFNFRYAAKRATPGVVHIKSVVPVKRDIEVPDFFKDFFGDDFRQRNFSPHDNSPQLLTGSASGVVITNDGYIVTNNHVVDGAQSLEVILYDQRIYKARVIGTDPATDLALLKIDENKLSFLEFGNSDSVEVGDIVLAVGNPFNLASTVTAGIVSAKARNINILTDKAAIESYIQTDAAVNQGNSGGALVDVNGRLIGINAAISTPTGAYAGYAFAIPVEIVKKTIDDLLKYGKVLRGYLGIIISDMNGEKAKLLGISTSTGVIVDSLQKNGAAIQAGIQPKDVIIKIDEHVLESVPQLRELVARHQPGEKLRLTVIRGGKEIVIAVTLQPAQEEVAASPADNQLLKTLGIELADLTSGEKKQLHLPGGVKSLPSMTEKLPVILKCVKGLL